jgi:hypothetical protein
MYVSLRTTGRSALIGTLLLAASSGPVLAEETVYYAGFAYLGNSEHIASSYPYTDSIDPVPANGSVTNQTPQLDEALRERVSGVRFSNIDLRTREKATLESGSATALAFVVDRETVSIERIGGHYKLLVEISAQALFFDYVGKAIIGAYPIGVRYIDTLDSEPSNEQIQGVVKQIYLGGLKVNIFDEFVERLQNANIKRAYGARMQVSRVRIADAAKPFLPLESQNNLKQLEASLADDFSKYLAKNQNVPLLPYSKGHAIGNRMALTVANGEVFNLEMPEADFEIQLTLNGFRKVIREKKAAGTSWIYAAYIEVEVKEPLSGDVYLNAQFKNGGQKIVPVSQTLVDDWPAFQEVLVVLFDKLTKELSDPSSSWTQTYSPSAGAYEGLKQFKEVIERCI